MMCSLSASGQGCIKSQQPRSNPILVNGSRRGLKLRLRRISQRHLAGRRVLSIAKWQLTHLRGLAFKQGNHIKSTSYAPLDKSDRFAFKQESLAQACRK